MPQVTKKKRKSNSQPKSKGKVFEKIWENSNPSIGLDLEEFEKSVQIHDLIERSGEDDSHSDVPVFD